MGRRVIELLTNSMGPEIEKSQDTTRVVTSRSRKSLVRVVAIIASYRENSVNRRATNIIRRNKSVMCVCERVSVAMVASCGISVKRILTTSLVWDLCRMDERTED